MDQIIPIDDPKQKGEILLDETIFVNPTAICCEDSDHYLIVIANNHEVPKGEHADAVPDVKDPTIRKQLAGNIIRVKIEKNGSLWSLSLVEKEKPSPLLSQDGIESDNPLIYPTALVVDGPGRYIICDQGVKNHVGSMGLPSTNLRSLAEPARLYLVKDKMPPQLLQARSGLSRPTRMAREPGGAILIADPGELEAPSIGLSIHVLRPIPRASRCCSRATDFL